MSHQMRTQTHTHTHTPPPKIQYEMMLLTRITGLMRQVTSTLTTLGESNLTQFRRQNIGKGNTTTQSALLICKAKPNPTKCVPNMFPPKFRHFGLWEAFSLV